MIDLKKLIGVFLVLATITSVLAFALLNPSPSPATTAAYTTDAGAAGVPKNAFLYPSQTGAAGFASANLTQYAALSLVRKMAALNREAPKIVNGKITVAAPTAEDIMNPLAQSGELKNIPIPDWGADASFGNPVVLRDYKADELDNYYARLNEILNRYFVETNLMNMFAANSTPENIISGEKAIGEAMTKIALLSVPERLLGFHKSFLKLLSYEKNGLALVSNATDDPLKASLIFKAQEKKYNATIADFQKELQRARTFKNISANKRTSGSLSLLDDAFGVKTAYAFWPVIDPGAIAEAVAQFAEDIYEFAYKTLLQILKNVLINQIQAQALNFIKGGGKPMFITNWRSFLANSVQGATNAAMMRTVIPGLCPSYSTQVLSSLGVLNSRFASGGGNSCLRDRQLAAQGTNITKFYGNFDNGGWAAYSALIPNNAYTAMSDAFDKIDKAGSDAKQTAQTKSTANQGMKGTEVCEDGSDPNGISYWCPDAMGVERYVPDGKITCPVSGTMPEPMENDGLCADGNDPETTTPGTGVGETLKTALKSNVDLIVNADSLAGLATAVAESMMTKLISAGVNGLLSPKTHITTSTIPMPPGVSCNPASQSADVGSAMTFGARGGNGTYVWSTGGGTAVTADGPVLEVSFGAPGIYTVGVTSDGKTANCAATAIQPVAAATSTPFSTP